MPNAQASTTLIALLIIGLTALPTSAAELPRFDFEQGTELGQYERLDVGSLDAAVVPRETEAGGHCLRIRNSTPATSCGVQLEGPVTLVKNLVDV